MLEEEYSVRLKVLDLIFLRSCLDLVGDICSGNEDISIYCFDLADKIFLELKRCVLNEK